MTKHMILLSLCLCLGACAQRPEKDSTQTQSHATHNAHEHESLPPEAASEMSLYQLESTWTNQLNQPVKLADAQPRVQLLAMIYASCDNACPRIIADMKAIEAQLTDQAVQLTLVSIDPEVDTPDKLKALGDKSQLTDKWQLLTGDPEDVLTLAALLGVQYKKISETDYAHSNIISVLNPQGEIVHQQNGLGVDPAATVRAVQSLF